MLLLQGTLKAVRVNVYVRIFFPHSQAYVFILKLRESVP